MLVFENGGWQINSESADTNYLEGTNEMQPRWVVHDNSEVAAKIMSAVRSWTPVEDEKSELVDITEIPPTQDELDEQRAAEIKRQLAELDNLTIRPLRAILTGMSTSEDTEKLREIEAQAAILRTELTELGEGE